MVGNPQTEEAQNRFICLRNRAVVVSVDYRREESKFRCLYYSLTISRAPEYPFPYALQDSIDVLEWAQVSTKSASSHKQGSKPDPAS
jgi:acetyl esterase/lipase